MERAVCIFANDGTIIQVQDTAFALVLSTAFRCVVECFVEVLSTLVFDIRVKPVTEIRRTCLPDVLRVPFAGRGSL